MNVTEVIAGQPPLQSVPAPRVPTELVRRAARRRRQTRPLGGTMRKGRRSQELRR